MLCRRVDGVSSHQSNRVLAQEVSGSRPLSVQVLFHLCLFGSHQKKSIPIKLGGMMELRTNSYLSLGWICLKL